MNGLARAGVAKCVLDAIGDTPLIEIEGLYAKLEFLNPSGSIKARIARYMIEQAESECLLKPGDTIVEASSGNTTGNALSMRSCREGLSDAGGYVDRAQRVCTKTTYNG